MDERNGEGSRPPPQSAFFGPFELRLDTRELRKHGVRVRLQAKPFQILRALLEQPGAVLTREDLRLKLWSTDTYVDFESGLNTAVNRLRTALGDAAENPIYIETLSRVGYRFIAPARFEARWPQVQAAESALAEPEPYGEIDSETKKLPKRTRQRWLMRRSLLIAVTCFAIAGGLFWAVSVANRQQTPMFRQITFGSGEISRARFVGDGSKVVYSAAWNGRRSHVFVADAKTREVRDLGFEGATVKAVSGPGQIAIYAPEANSGEGRLVFVSLLGARATRASEHATEFDRSPDGTECIIAPQGPERTIQCPPGRTLYRTTASIDYLRLSPDGKHVAFLSHPVPNDDAGEVVVLDPGSKPRVLSSSWASIRGLAWNPSGREIWFSAARSGIDRQLMAVTLSCQTRQIAEVPGGISLHDVSPSGELLITRDTSQVSMVWGQVKSRSSRDISWLDWSLAEGMSADGGRVLFDESGEGGGREYSSYVYDVSGGSYHRLGSGRAMDISPDGRWALTQTARNPYDLQRVSVSDGRYQRVAAPNFVYEWAKFLPGSGSNEVIVGGGSEHTEPGLFRQKLPDGAPVPISVPDRLKSAVIDADGRFLAGEGTDGAISVIDLEHVTTRRIVSAPHATPVRFISPDEIVVWRAESGSLLLEILNLKTGASRPYERLDSEPWITSDPESLFLSRDLQTYVCSRLHVQSTLFRVQGWR